MKRVEETCDISNWGRQSAKLTGRHWRVPGASGTLLFTLGHAHQSPVFKATFLSKRTVMGGFRLEDISQHQSIGELVFQLQMGSTNQRAVEILKQGPRAMPMLVLTENQTDGKGQGDRKWSSAKGALTCSYCLAAGVDFANSPVGLSISPLKAFQLPVIIGLAVCKTIDHYCDPSSVRLKWPNDVLIRGKKVGGILVEKVTCEGRSTFVIGIGVNLNNELPPNLTGADSNFPATSLNIASGSDIDVTNFLLAMLDSLVNLVQTLNNKPESIAALIEQCQSRLIFLNRRVTIELPNQERIFGTCIGLSESGQLQIESDIGIRDITSGRVIEIARQ